MTDESTVVEPILGQPDEDTTVAEETTVSTTTTTEEERPRRADQPEKSHLSIIVLVLLLLVVGACVIGLGLRGCTSGTTSTAGKAQLPSVEPTAPPKPPPAVPKGVSSWTDYAAKAAKKPYMMESLQKLYPEKDVRKEVANNVAAEKRGQKFIVLLKSPKGQRLLFINTYYTPKSSQQYHFFRDSLKKSTKFLLFADGTIAVKKGCGNAVRFDQGSPAKDKIAKASPHKAAPKHKSKKGVHKKGKGPDRTKGAARQPLRDHNAVTTHTPGYTGGGSGSSGGAEDVAKKQHDSAGSTDNNGQVGHEGAGNGPGSSTPAGSDSSGETNSGGGPAHNDVEGGDTTDASGDPGAPN